MAIRILKWIGLSIGVVILAFVALFSYALWTEYAENQISEAALTQLWDELRIGMYYDDEVSDLIRRNRNIRGDFYWRNDKPIGMPRPLELSDEKEFPNDRKTNVAYTVIGLCLAEAGSELCRKEREEDELHYVALILRRPNPKDEFLVEDAFRLTYKNGITTIVGQKGNPKPVNSQGESLSSAATTTDEEIQQRGRKSIKANFDDTVHINVTAVNHSVLLTGQVPDNSSKARAEDIIARINGVKSITNELLVARDSGLISRIYDFYIKFKIKNRLDEATDIPSKKVTVIVEDNVVYLMGRVTDKEANTAVETARTTTGVKKVVRAFEY